MSDEWKAPTESAADDTGDKSWKLLEKTLLAGVQEQRRARRWGIFFKLLTFVYLFVALLLFTPLMDMEKSAARGAGYTALIEVTGMIADKEPASADNIVTSLRAAFEDSKVKGIVLRINSSGGSPVQSGYVYDEIRRLRGLHPDIKVYAVIADLGASGAYYIASAADQIYADKASLVGSIGVTAAGYGFVGTMEKLGVERRTYTSGEHKSFLDPFQPQKPEETQFWQGVLDTTHRQFIASVKQGRGERLKDKDHPELFSGLVWSGEQALQLGLIDGLGSASSVARDVVGEKELVDFTVQESPFDCFSKKLGASVAERLAMWMGFQGPTLR
ncbi:S49 family peptidase [Pseudomonas sp. MRSN 12121]|uniref:S49 family peptidase n=1 Tax=Pseudomonas sp. MRSN 12121 TaxID=1611770 RepID=UPI0005BED423|nr:S49 family peptidase [Pseudomonas sp. MRSN 12121]AJO77419.1 peptidase S49 [Pseudomonas sp. MRSN 12121]